MVQKILDEVSCFAVPKEGMLCFTRDKRGKIIFRKINDKFCFRGIKEMEQGEDWQIIVGDPITFLVGWGCHGFEPKQREFSKGDEQQAKLINIKHSKMFPLVGEVI